MNSPIMVVSNRVDLVMIVIMIYPVNSVTFLIRLCLLFQIWLFGHQNQITEKENLEVEFCRILAASFWNMA